MPPAKIFKSRNGQRCCRYLLLAAKIVAYYITHSVSILTDALEGIVNVAAGWFGLYSLYLSAKPRDSDHPYGHGKIEFIPAGIEGAIVSVAGVLILSEAVKKPFYSSRDRSAEYRHDHPLGDGCH